ncbi:uncharacterized protein LOC132607832 [Lycium barbarum]|uniref:uncharacterized protein LOC132607832 n=1 Tax=Lycium barbarum TaxID=112863 RepID=UPI00293ECC66|nr:uncharacterized protein LOC132607832 [Lycium barbarum]
MSRVVHDRLETVLPQLISINQAGFVQGRSIIENVLLAQEIVIDIRKRGKPANVVIKFDMEKTYDRVSWSYLIKVLSRMRFASQFIDMIWRLIANNWYSILFIEVLSRALNAEFDNAEYVGYGMPKWSQNVNHLAYADDTIICASAEGESLKRIMKILQEYEAISGQLLNKGKSAFYMHHKISGALSQQVEQICHDATRGRDGRKNVYYNDLIKKVKNKLQNWKGKLLSFGGKAVLINSVLQSFPIYMLSAVVPTKYIPLMSFIKSLQGFTWSTKEEAFMWNKYCKKKKPIEVQWKGGSQVWKRMIEARDQVDQQIWWEPRNGECDVWEDNWTKLGSLKQVIPPDFQIDTSIEEVSHFFNAEGWDVQELHKKLPSNVCDHILQELSIVEHSEEKDKAWWISSTTGDFTVGSAWNLLRKKAQTSAHFS